MGEHQNLTAKCSKNLNVQERGKTDHAPSLADLASNSICEESEGALFPVFGTGTEINSVQIWRW